MYIVCFVNISIGISIKKNIEIIIKHDIDNKTSIFLNLSFSKVFWKIKYLSEKPYIAAITSYTSRYNLPSIPISSVFVKPFFIKITLRIKKEIINSKWVLINDIFISADLLIINSKDFFLFLMTKIDSEKKIKNLLKIRPDQFNLNKKRKREIVKKSKTDNGASKFSSLIAFLKLLLS